MGRFESELESVVTAIQRVCPGFSRDGLALRVYDFSSSLGGLFGSLEIPSVPGGSRTEVAVRLGPDGAPRMAFRDAFGEDFEGVLPPFDRLSMPHRVDAQFSATSALIELRNWFGGTSRFLMLAADGYVVGRPVKDAEVETDVAIAVDAIEFLGRCLGDGRLEPAALARGEVRGQVGHLMFWSGILDQLLVPSPKSRRGHEIAIELLKAHRDFGVEDQNSLEKIDVIRTFGEVSPPTGASVTSARLVHGLADAVLVVEAAGMSGWTMSPSVARSWLSQARHAIQGMDLDMTARTVEPCQVRGEMFDGTDLLSAWLSATMTFG
jgi:hypothetical protein